MSMEITPEAVRAMIEGGGEDLYLIDCRRDDEVALARIEGAVHVPMEHIVRSAEDIAEEAEGKTVVVYCHHGVRSLAAAAQLRAGGARNVLSMSGGIDRWSLAVDPAVPRY